MKYINIEKELIPYTFKIVLRSEEFEFGVDYNVTADLFTLSVSKGGKELCAGEPLIYGVPLFCDLYTRGGFPLVVLCPMDESFETHAVTYDNLSSTVWLCVDEVGEDGE